MSKKKIIVIGAGISGLTAGIYGLDNDFDVDIYEKNNIPGGECIGWYRKGIYIDGCAHWIVGTHKHSDFYPLWEHIGAITDDTKIYDADYFAKFHIGDDIITLYSDLDELHKELMRISPQDKKVINEICTRIEHYQHVRVPLAKPIDMMNLFELISHGFKMLPLLSSYIYTRKESLGDLANKFKDERLRLIFKEILDIEEYNSHSMYYTLAMLAKKDAGIPEGGSLNLSLRVANRFKELDGNLYFSTPVKRVIIENGVAKGVELENGEIKYADYIVSSTDIDFTFRQLIGEEYRSKAYQNMFSHPEDYRSTGTYFLSYRIKNKNHEINKTEFFQIEPFKVGNDTIKFLKARSHSFDETINAKDSHVVTVMIYASFDTYDYLKTLTKEEYTKLKQDLGEHCRKELIKQVPIKEEEIELLDVATPLTYERYVNAYKGSYMAFITTKRSKGLFQPNYHKRLKNFVFAGQWLMPPGGLPPAVLTGKYAAVRIAKWNKQKFINKEDKKAKFYTKKRKKPH